MGVPTANSTVKNFYTYMWLREDGTPYYVGKGTGKRGFYSRSHSVHAPKDRSRIIVFPMESEALAFESEIALIGLFGRKDKGTGILRNLTNGGDGVGVDYVPSLEWRRKMSKSMLGNKNALGSKQSEVARQRKRMASLGNRNSLGIKRSETYKRKMSEITKAWWAKATPEERKARHRSC